MMSRKQKLSDMLRMGAGASWKSAALTALDSNQVVLAGDEAWATAGDLLRIYRIRLTHFQEKGVQAIGINEFLQSLERLAPGNVIRVEPYMGPQTIVGAFWDAAENLIGCMTVLGWGPERGQENLDFSKGGQSEA
jgi:hypothetical protein